MHPSLRTFLAAAAVAAPLALGAAPAYAAETYGSDLKPTHQEGALSCAAYPCVLSQDTFAGGWNADIARTGVITKWRVKLDEGTRAKLRLLENNFGQDYQPKAEGPSVTGTGEISEVDTRIPLNGGRYYAGVQLDSGKMLVDVLGDDDGAKLLEFDGSWNDDVWRSADRSGPFEALSQVVVEPDIDGDGFGDDTQDDCVFCSGDDDNGGGGNGDIILPPGYGSSSGGSSGGGGFSGGGGGGGSSSYTNTRPPFKVVIDNRGFFEIRDGKPQITVYLDNQGRKDLEGTVNLSYGKKTLKRRFKGTTGKLSIDSGEQDYTSNFALPKALVKKIKRKGSATLKATASFPGAGTVTQTIKVRKSGLTNRYDGTYKGSNGIQLIVSGGFLVSITQTLNTYCTGSHRFQFETLFALPGYPLQIGRDGSFAAKGSRSADSIKYEGKIAPKGPFKGYSSIFHSQINPNSSDRIAFEQCFAASNWTAKRVK